MNFSVTQKPLLKNIEIEYKWHWRRNGTCPVVIVQTVSFGQIDWCRMQVLAIESIDLFETMRHAPTHAPLGRLHARQNTSIETCNHSKRPVAAFETIDRLLLTIYRVSCGDFPKFIFNIQLYFNFKCNQYTRVIHVQRVRHRIKSYQSMECTLCVDKVQIEREKQVSLFIAMCGERDQRNIIHSSSGRLGACVCMCVHMCALAACTSPLHFTINLPRELLSVEWVDFYL